MIRTTLTILACAGFLVGGRAHAEQYTLLVFESPAEMAHRDARDAASAAYWSAYADFGRQLADAGIARGGAALRPDAQVAVDGRPLGGYFMIDVPTQDEARHWADRAPATLRGGRVIVTGAVAMPATATATATAR